MKVINSRKNLDEKINAGFADEFGEESFEEEGCGHHHGEGHCCGGHGECGCGHHHGEEHECCGHCHHEEE